jgi:hypothetical protein
MLIKVRCIVSNNFLSIVDISIFVVNCCCFVKNCLISNIRFRTLRSIGNIAALCFLQVVLGDLLLLCILPEKFLVKLQLKIPVQV